MVIAVIRWSRFLRHQWYQKVRMPENSLLNCYLGIQKYSFRSSPLSWRVEHTINRILETSTPLFLKAQNCPVLALTKINVVLYSSRSEIKGFLKMLLNQFVCGRYDIRAQRLPVHRQLEGSGSRESELVSSESWGAGYTTRLLCGVRNSILGWALTESSGKLPTCFIYIPQSTNYIYVAHALETYACIRQKIKQTHCL